MRCIHLYFKTAFTLVAVLCAGTAIAADNACLLRGSINESGVVQVVNYCAINKGMSTANFRLHCQELHANHVEGLSPAAARRLALQFTSACPAVYKAACDSAFGQNMTLQFMAGDTLLADKTGALFCQSSGGRWR